MGHAHTGTEQHKIGTLRSLGKESIHHTGTNYLFYINLLCFEIFGVYFIWLFIFCYLLYDILSKIYYV